VQPGIEHGQVLPDDRDRADLQNQSKAGFNHQCAPDQERDIRFEEA
jgi:hypothetical protein